jgi:hypothetical protein
MGGVSDHISPQLLGALKVASHGVKGLGQLAYLAFIPDMDSL